jgi:predicted CxxxxCH...CXXCH cytochrome family protein
LHHLLPVAPAARVFSPVIAGFALLGTACASGRHDPEPPAYADVKSLLDARCARCHAESAPAAGWRADSYVGAISCTADGRPAATAAADAPILAALDRPDHAGFASPEERERLGQWLRGGASSVRAGVHPWAFANPRSGAGHARMLRDGRYRALLDADDPDACARCHDGVPGRPATIAFAAPGATACTSCHAEAGFPFACATCHGSEGKSARNPCFHEEAPAHRAHARSSKSHADGLPCSSCHPVPADGRPSATHANGWTEVWFDFAIAGREARFEPSSKRCTGTCHARGGARPEVAWNEAPVACNDCHRTPPVPHFPPPCSSCHAEANVDGTALASPRLHVNGHLDFSATPGSGAHPAHLAPENAVAVACETCHALPFSPGPISVRLSGLATRGGRQATYDPATKTCAGTYCHEGAGGTVQAPSWSTGSPARACGACHASPPPPPHSTGTLCSSAACHLGITSSPSAITPAGRAVHVNGTIDRSVP